MNVIDSTSLKILVFLSVVGIGILVQLLEYHKIDDEPVRSFYVPTFNLRSSTLSGTATISDSVFYLKQ